MKRQSDETEALVYAYGAIPPAGNEWVRAEVDKMRNMWDALVASDRQHDCDTDRAIRASSPEYAQVVDSLDSAWAHLRDCIERRNAERGRTKQRATSIDAEVTAAVKARNEWRTKAWALAKQWRKENKETVKALETARRDRNKLIRQRSGLYWCNYNRVLDDFEQARKTCMKKGRRVQQYDRTREDGCLTVQIQRTKSGLGADFAELTGGVFRPLQLGAVPAGVEDLPTRKRARECKTTLTMRVDAAGHTIQCPIWLHRAPPRGGRVKSAQITWKREGEKLVGRLCLTVSAPKRSPKHGSRTGCGIDLGWRLRPGGGMRVAYGVASNGGVVELELPADWMRGMDQVERLHGYIDDGVLEVAQWLHAHSEAPEQLRIHAQDWRPGLGARHVDAAGLHDAVRALSFGVPPEVRHWYDRYRHLLLWRDNLRGKLLRRRREIYRLFARRVAMTHALIGLEDMDLSKMARTKKRDDATDPELWAAARAQRQRACVHELRAEIEHQARKHGARPVYATTNTTTCCKECGAITEQIDRTKLTWVCEHCGAVWDQDHNAADNLLTYAMGIASDYIAPAPQDHESTSYINRGAGCRVPLENAPTEPT